MRPPHPTAAQGDTAIFKGFNKIHTTAYSLLGLTILFSSPQLKGVQGRSLGIPHITQAPRIPFRLSKLFSAFLVSSRRLRGGFHLF